MAIQRVITVRPGSTPVALAVVPAYPLRIVAAERLEVCAKAYLAADTTYVCQPFLVRGQEGSAYYPVTGGSVFAAVLECGDWIEVAPTAVDANNGLTFACFAGRVP